MNDRITHFGGINRSSARHLARKEDERRTDAGADLFACGNVQTSTGAARKRDGLSIQVHFPSHTLVWPDVLGNFKPHTGKIWNFVFGSIGTNDGYDINDWDEGGGGGGGGGGWRKWPPKPNPVEESWRFKHIVRSINARLKYFNASITSLPVNKQDVDVTEQDIADARSAIEGFIPNMFVSHRITHVDTNVGFRETDGVQDFINLNDLLNEAKTGLLQQDGTRTWGGWSLVRIVFGIPIFARDPFTEMEKALRVLTRIYLSPRRRWVGNYTWVRHSTFSFNTDQRSPAFEMHQFNDTNPPSLVIPKAGAAIKLFALSLNFYCWYNGGNHPEYLAQYPYFVGGPTEYAFANDLEELGINQTRTLTQKNWPSANYNGVPRILVQLPGQEPYFDAGSHYNGLFDLFTDVTFAEDTKLGSTQR